MRSSAGPQQKAYAQRIKVEIFGPEAANWPEVGKIFDHPRKPGVKLRYIGGDPADDQNMVEVK